MNISSIKESVESGARAAKLNVMRNEMTEGITGMRHVLRSLGFEAEQIEEMAGNGDKNVHTLLWQNESETIH